MTGSGHRYEFDGFRLDPVGHELRRAGVPVALEPKAFGVLGELVAHAGALRSRDELLDAVWGHRHVTPGVLNRSIAQLRRALGDDANHPRYIQTVHALGYRFIAPVADAADGAGERVAAPPGATGTSETRCRAPEPGPATAAEMPFDLPTDESLSVELAAAMATIAASVSRTFAPTFAAISSNSAKLITRPTVSPGRGSFRIS